jgi:2',3'-cyclic-nucleotide 2'-phosphodiesterase (5'-nucleotidase family)
MSYGQVMLVDNGGFFPEQDDSLYRNVAWFLMDGMKLLGSDAVGMSEKELRYGRGFLLAQIKRTQLPMTCANLFDQGTNKTLLPPFMVKKIGGVNVGVFSLMSDKVDLGPSRDSLFVEEPSAAAKRTVDALRKKGATVIVLLSQLGKVESEDLVTAVDGIDAVMVGRNVPLLQQGRLIKNTVACYGGEQGQYMGRTILSLTPAKKSASGINETFMLSPEVGERQDILALVKSFEDNFNDMLRKREKEKAAAQATQSSSGDQAVDHFVGTELCARCHQAEFEQWKTTKHAKAWQTLVDIKKESTPDCVPCHVVGYKKPGGFQVADDATKLGNVGCENCHGMGTSHEAYPTQAQRITEATCQQCHTSNTSPNFSFAVFQPHVVHKTPSGPLPTIPPNPAKQKLMMGSVSN